MVLGLSYPTRVMQNVRAFSHIIPLKRSPSLFASCGPDFLLLRYLKREERAERKIGQSRAGRGGGEAKKELTFMLIRIESCCGFDFCRRAALCIAAGGVIDSLTFFAEVTSKLLL